MRILILTNTFPSPSGTFVFAHVRGLAERGHEVTLLAKRSQGPVREISDLPFRVVYFSSRRRRTAPILTAVFAVRHLLRHPTQFFRVLAQVLVHHDWAVLQAFAASKRLAGEVYDLTHAEFGPLGNLALALGACGIGTGPVSTSFRGSDISSYLGRHPHAYKLLAQRGELFMPVCEAFIPRLTALGFPSERTTVYHSAIDLSGFPQRGAAKGGLSGKIRLIAIGRIVRKKGFHLAVEVLHRVVESGIDTELEIIGDGPERKALLRHAVDMGVTERLITPGWLGRDEIRAHLTDAVVCLGTSVTPDTGELEGIPNVLKEAMAVGVPVVAFDHSGVGELVRDGVTGFLVPEGDVETMAAAVIRFARDESLARRITGAARDLVEREYGADVQAEVAERLYTALVANEGNVPSGGKSPS